MSGRASKFLIRDVHKLKLSRTLRMSQTLQPALSLTLPSLSLSLRHQHAQDHAYATSRIISRDFHIDPLQMTRQQQGFNGIPAAYRDAATNSYSHSRTYDNNRNGSGNGNGNSNSNARNGHGHGNNGTSSHSNSCTPGKKDKHIRKRGQRKPRRKEQGYRTPSSAPAPSSFRRPSATEDHQESSKLRAPSSNANKDRGGGVSSVIKQTQRLQTIQDEVHHLMKEYEDQMQTSIHTHHPKNDKQQQQQHKGQVQEQDMTMDPATLTENLLRTEDVYRKTCIKLRQLIAGWSWIKPFPRYYAEQWAKNQQDNPLPPHHALKYLNLLESIRERRQNLIQLHDVDGDSHGANTSVNGEMNGNEIRRDGMQQPAKSQGIVQWFTDAFSNHYTGNSSASVSANGRHVGSASTDTLNLSRETAEDLTAHISHDCTANARLYDCVLNSSVQWRHMSVQDSHSQPGYWMESVLENMRDSAKRGNPNVDPDIKIYHRLMEFYKGSATFAEVSKNLKLLKEMLEISKENRKGLNDMGGGGSEHAKSDVEANASNANASCWPTNETYELAVSSFHGIGSTVDIKVKAIEAADEVLRLMEEEYRCTGTGTGVESNATGISKITTSNRNHRFETNAELMKLDICDPYRAMLQNLIAVGSKVLPDYQRRTDDIMERMMGKKAYENLLEDNGALVDTTKIDHLVLHDLIHAFSITNDKKQLGKARVILKKMEATRDSALQGAALTWNENFPLGNSYKSIIIGVLHSTIDDEKVINNVASVDDALYAMELLDTILREKPTLRNSFSCYRVIRLWGATNVKEAGRRGEEILGRLEMSQLINGDPRTDQSPMRDVVLRSKQSALENWSTSAAAGEPGAARSAANFLERTKGRLDHEMGSLDERSRRERSFFYIAVIRACADTVVSEDKEDALEIAFDTYNTMVEEEVILTPYLFVQMMKCCQLVAPSSHYQALKLSKEVFQAACSNGLVNKHVLFLLKQVNYHLFESYKKQPEHSANVKKMMPLEE